MTPIEKFLDLKELQQMVADIELKALSEKTKFLLHNAVEKISPEDRHILLTWIENVEKVRKDLDMGQAEKEQKIHDLETSRVVSEFLNRIAHTIFDRLMPHKKGLLEAGMAGLGLWAAGIKPELAAVGYFALKKVLPHFLLSQQGGVFLSSLRNKLQPGVRVLKSH
jgi:hypothetical protein